LKPQVRQPWRSQLLCGLAVSISLILSLNSAQAGLPAENDCPTLSPAAKKGEESDAGAVQLHEGMILTADQLLLLQKLIPTEIWSHREIFFHEGMRLAIGPCHRRYPPPGFFDAATQKFSAEVKLTKRGDLKNYVAGIPFPQEAIAADDPLAGHRWAWNYAQRYRGGGAAGRFRILDLASSMGKEQVYIGEFAWILTGHRADLKDSDYRLEESKKNAWIFGGKFVEPFDARHLAWRQYRDLKSEKDSRRPDDIFVYLPTMRKQRRAANSWSDGLYVPSYRVSGDSAGGGIAFGVGAYGAGGQSVSPKAGVAAAVSENLRRGFVGLMLRPNAYRWSLHSEVDVLAPLNVKNTGWPTSPYRNYGTRGLSLGDDVWDVRHAVILIGHAIREDSRVKRIKLYIDYETLQPLYYVSTKSGGGILEVGILAHRYSSDQEHYPNYKNGDPVQAFDTVAAVFYTSGGGGWRRESYDVRSTPLETSVVQSYLSTANLDRGH
jgi:hypothetical protein